MYRLFFRWVLARFDAESVHHVAFALLRLAAALPLCLPLLRWLLRPTSSRLHVRALGQHFDSPLGLAAGFDKDARAYEPLAALGFGFVEVGTLTGQPQPGNPRPRLFRLLEDRALLNRLGFNNGGSAAAVGRLKGARSVPVGVNIGKTKRVEEAEAIDDYVASAERLACVADYLVVNVSSPNTPGLRNLQAVDKLRPLLVAVREALDRKSPERRVPLLVKIAPDLAEPDVDAVAELALELKLDGILATNTTLSREGLHTPAESLSALGAGGVSGAPLKWRSLQLLRRLREKVGDQTLLISVGGVESAEDVLQRLRAGASLVQVYTAFVYGGPFWLARLHRELERLLAEQGVTSVQDVIGRDAGT